MKSTSCIILFLIVYSSCKVVQRESAPEIAREILWTSAWSPDGKIIAVGGSQSDLMFFDANNFNLIKTYPVKDVIISRLKWHPEGKLLAVVTQSQDVIARILNVETGKWIALEGLESSSRGVDWNHNGEMLAVSEFEGEVSIFNTSGKRIRRFMADPKSVTDLDWHPTKDIMVTVGSRVGIYTQDGDSIKTFKTR